MTPLLELCDLTVSYGDAPVLDHMNLVLEEGSYYGIVGPSGAGKTTLLRAILGTVKPVGGEVLVAGRPVRRGLASVGYVPQVETVDWNFPVTVAEVVAMGRAAEGTFSPRLNRGLRQEIRDLLPRIGLAGFLDPHTRAFS